jgi:hypothetical protein
MTKLVTPLPSNRAAATSPSPPPVGGSLPPAAWETEEKMVPLAVAVGEGLRGGPAWTVTSGVAVALGLGASTHLVTLTPLAVAVVVQKEPCAEAAGARIRTAIMANEADINSSLTGTPPPGG